MSCTPTIEPIGIFDFKLPLGSHYEIPLTWSAVDDPATLTDFTGAFAEIEIRDGGETGTVVLTLTTTAGHIEINGTTMTAIFLSDETASLSAKQKSYFWRITMPDADEQTILKGKITPIRS
jgi:hypothetical protein